MNGFLAVSFWIALVTVVPGLITIATVFGAVVLVDPTYVSGLDTDINQGLWGAIAITVMILTQAFGILLEDKLVSRKSLGGKIDVPEKFFDSMESLSDSKCIDPYKEYQFLYFLLVRLGEGDDIHGHLERAVAQFFLSNNTLVSFAAGIVATGGIVIMSLLTQGFVPVILVRGGVYAGLLVVALFISFRVTIARFEVMAISTWSLRNQPSWDPSPDE